MAGFMRELAGSCTKIGSVLSILSLIKFLYSVKQKQKETSLLGSLLALGLSKE